MAIKKNAAKANIGPKKQVKATFAECTAENPLKCRYHGLKALDSLIGNVLASTGHPSPFVTDKHADEYELRLPSTLDLSKNDFAKIVYALHKEGFSIFNKGQLENGAWQYKIKPSDGSGFETPEGEAELEDADTLSSEEGPKKDKAPSEHKDPFEELENLDIDALADELEADLLDNYNELESVAEEAAEDLEAELLGNTEFDDDVFADATEEGSVLPEITEADCVALMKAAGINPNEFADDAPSKWLEVITNGNNAYGVPISGDVLKLWQGIAEKADYSGEDLPALAVLKDTLSKLEKKERDLNSSNTTASDMEKYAAQWNNLMDTAINGKKLMGTQYWAENVQPIVEDYNEAIANNDQQQVQSAVMELQEAIKNAPASSSTPTMESLTGEMDNIIAKMKDTGLDLTWDAKKGNALGKAFEDAINSGNTDKAAKALQEFKDYISFLESGGDMPDDMEEELTTEDIKDFFKKCGIKKESLLSDANLAATKEALETGKWNGKPLTKGNKKWYEQLAKKAPDHKVANAINEMLSADKMKPKKIKKGSAKEILSAALGGSSEPMVAEGMLKPLEHDESKFPQNVTQKELEEAIKHPIKKLGGHGGLGTRLIEIDGKQYVCKAASGTGASVIRNGYNADMAYRAGGVYAPDAKLYEFGNGKTYKLSEFIPGKRLIDVWKDADETTKDGIRKDLLKGYPLDVLFSNYDVLGTSPEDTVTVMIQGADGKPQKTHVAFNNIMIGDDGHAYRVDNDGAFAMTGTGSTKHSGGGGYTAKVEAEKWDNWEDRQWIDDFRTLRRNEKNLGIFDRYSTADIFLSAGNINLNAAVDTLPQGIQDALAKPLFEMKQMTMRALSASLSGVKNEVMLSAALDAAYEASKQGFRELCIGEISFSSGGIGAKESDKGEIPPYPVAKPAPPEDPSKKFAAGSMLSNADYKGTKVSEIILDAAKTINYHAGFVMTDAQGNKLGGGKALPTPDFSPNSSKIAAFKKIDREKLVELAKTSESAKAVLNYYDSVATSIDNGYKLPVQEVKQTSINELLPSGFKTKAEVEFETNKEKVMSQYHVDLKKYHDVTLPEYFKGKKEWEDNEKAKLRAGVHGLEGNFYDIANEFMEAAYNTDGIAQHNGESIDFIELGKYQNKYGGNVSGASTHNDSWTPASSHLKVLDLLMSGRSLEDIVNISNDDPLVNNGHHSGKKAKDWFIGEAKKMLSDPEQTRREMIAYAVFKGLQVVKLENETADVSLSTGGKVPWIDHGCHTVALIRKESFSNASDNTIAPVVQKGGNVSCGFQSNGSIGIYPYAYDVPLWNVAYTYSDANHKGSKVEAYQGSEHEWVANLVGLTPFRVNSSTNASQNVNLSRNNATLKKAREKRISRLAPFFTTMADLKNIVKKII